MRLGHPLTPVEKLAIGTHGFPLPDIKTWNSFVETMFDSGYSGEHLKGSVEDLANGRCTPCGGDIIRQDVTIFDPRELFVVGIIYCPRSVNNHPAYWVDVWPNANWPQRAKDDIGRRTTEGREYYENFFRLSDSRIRKCFLRYDLFEHRLAQLKRRREHGYKRELLPSPTYVHKR